MILHHFRLSRRIRREHIGPPLQPRIAISPASKPIEVIVTKPSNELTNNNAISPNIEKQKARVHLLEKQVQHQQTEITGLRDVVDDLRSSLQLSDAQNLALQVLLKKMAKGESFYPSLLHSSFIPSFIFSWSAITSHWTRLVPLSDGWERETSWEPSQGTQRDESNQIS